MQIRAEKTTGRKNRGRLLAALLAAVLFTVGLTACGQGDVSTSSTASSQGQTESGTSSASSAVERIEEKDVEDTLEGLTKYMANNYSLGEASETRGDMIGAQKKGYRYITQTVQVEFYAFDLDTLNDEAKKVIESVKKDGTFQIMDQTVENAYLSDSGKYLMIYTDRVGSEDTQATAKKALEDFKAFKK